MARRDPAGLFCEGGLQAPGHQGDVTRHFIWWKHKPSLFLKKIILTSFLFTWVIILTKDKNVLSASVQSWQTAALASGPLMFADLGGGSGMPGARTVSPLRVQGPAALTGALPTPGPLGHGDVTGTVDTGLWDGTGDVS